MLIHTYNVLVWPRYVFWIHVAGVFCLLYLLRVSPFFYNMFFNFHFVLLLNLANSEWSDGKIRQEESEGRMENGCITRDENIPVSVIEWKKSQGKKRQGRMSTICNLNESKLLFGILNCDRLFYFTNKSGLHCLFRSLSVISNFLFRSLYKFILYFHSFSRKVIRSTYFS